MSIFKRPKDWHPRKIAEFKCSPSLADWLTSNPVADKYSLEIPSIVVLFDFGCMGWPIVPEPRP